MRTRHRASSLAAALAALVTTAACAGTAPGPAVFDAHYHDRRVTRLLALLPLHVKLDADDDVRVEPLGRDERMSHHLVAIRTGETPHRHDRHDLIVVIVEGHGRMLLGNTVRSVGRGSVLYVPRGTPHAFVNEARNPAVALAIYSPPFDGRDRAPVEPLPAGLQTD